MRSKYNYTSTDLELMKQHGLRCITFYDEKIEIAKKAGHDSYIKFVIETDKATGSTRKTGEIVGMEQCATIKMLRRLGVPRRFKGGANNPWGRKGKPCQKD